MRRRHFLRKNLFIDPVQILSPLYHYIQNTTLNINCKVFLALITPFNYICNNSTPQWWLGRTFIVKGVIEIIFVVKFSQSFIKA